MKSLHISCRNGRCGGFTLVELIVVILIIGVLAAFLAPQVIKYVSKSRESVCINDRGELSSAASTLAADENINWTDYAKEADPYDAVTQKLLAEGAIDKIPSCPAGGTYSIDSISQYNVTFRCSVHSGEGSSPTDISTTAKPMSDVLTSTVLQTTRLVKFKSNQAVDSSLPDSSLKGSGKAEILAVLEKNNYEPADNNINTWQISKNGSSDYKITVSSLDISQYKNGDSIKSIQSSNGTYSVGYATVTLYTKNKPNYNRIAAFSPEGTTYSSYADAVAAYNKLSDTK